MVDEKSFADISSFQTYLFNTGDNFKAYEMLGSERIDIDGKKCWRFSVWAPNALAVRVAGEKNGWTGEGRELQKIGTTGIWYGVFDDVEEGEMYKYSIDAQDGETYLRSDPYARQCEMRPGTASVTRASRPYKWSDKRHMNARGKKDSIKSPMNIYEVHAGSWRIHDDGSFYNYKELADELVPYVKEMGYTHIELMPLMEYPFDGSWGYQVTGYFAATSRYGTPDDLKYFVNKCHKENISVIMDWVPAHFPRDAHGLRMFDGTPNYEYADPRMGEHKDWGTMVFDYSKSEVISFLTSSAYFWVNEYHIDGLRVDAVSSMLYRDYSRNDGEWLPNKYGGNGNLEAVDFFHKLNKIMGTEFPGVLMIAEESTAWPKVTVPPDDGGLGFHFKWNMGWMNDSLRYVSMDPYFRAGAHNLLTFVTMYAYSENFILPLSHDEVVHGKASLIGKMFGDHDLKFPEYRTFLGYYMSMSGKKLMFMGGEMGQFLEWRFDDQLEWNILGLEQHQKLRQYVRDLNAFYLENPAMWELDQDWHGFEWINGDDKDNSVYSYIRRGTKKKDEVIVVANFSSQDIPVYEMGVPEYESYEVVIHSNSTKYGGTRRIGKKTYKARKIPMNGKDYSLKLFLDANSVMYLKKKEKTGGKNKSK